VNDVSPSGEAATLFEVVGGRPFFDRLVDRFFRGGGGPTTATAVVQGVAVGARFGDPSSPGRFGRLPAMTTTRRFRLFTPVLSFALVLGLAGCGGDDSNEASGDTTEAESTEAEATAESSAPESSAPESSEGGGEGGDAVTIVDFNFDPSPITVAAGTEVTWTNEDDATHTVTAEDDSFDSDDLEKGATYAETFDEAGTFAYVCSIHPSMSGELVVE